jgi:small subunit ribosomal protein S3
MGQKVHPTGFRLGIAADWTSKWYADTTQFADFLAEDLKIREFLKKKLAQAAISRIQISRPAKSVAVTIHTARPGIIIGKKGEDIERLRIEVASLVSAHLNNVKINIEEIRKPELDAQLVAEGVASQLERRVMFRRAMRRSVTNAMRIGAEGIKINVAGRLNGAEIVSRRSRATAYPARRCRLRFCRSPDYLRHPWRKGLDLQGRGFRS